MSTILVQTTDRAHTLAALDAACCLACDHRHTIVLLKLIPVTHPSWLGTEFEFMALTERDTDSLREYQRLVESGGIKAERLCLPVVSSLDGIVWAAESVDARIVFADLPHSLIPFWNIWQTAMLRRRLMQMECQLYVSNGHTHVWIPIPNYSGFVTK